MEKNAKWGKKKESFGKESDRTVEKVKRIDAIGSEKWKNKMNQISGGRKRTRELEELKKRAIKCRKKKYPVWREDEIKEI